MTLIKKVLIVEDHTLLRESLVKMVSEEPGFLVISDTGRGDLAIEQAKKDRPDIVLLDIGLPGEGGLEVAAELRRMDPKVRILFLTMYDSDEMVRRAVQLAEGFVPKSSSSEELLEALRTVAAGGSYLGPGITQKVMEMASGKSSSGLTEREVEILELLAGGSRPQEVAEKMFLSVKTIKNHLTAIYAKLGVESAAQAVAEAYQRGHVGRDL